MQGNPVSAAFALAFLTATIGLQAQCKPASSSETGAEIERLSRAARLDPQNPLLLYNLAADYASKCDSAKTLELLQKVASLPGGLDPSAYRGFAPLRDEPKFKAIVAEIRQANSVKVQSTLAFAIKEPDLFPEGMAYARFNGRIYAGSVKRKIVWTDHSGSVHDLAPPAEDGLAYVAGLHVDEQRKQLWAVSSKFGNAPELSNAVQGLFQYNLISGKRLNTFRAPNASSGYLNDVTVVPSTGIAYTTNTAEGSVYRTNTKTNTLEQFLPSGSVAGANGIALSDDEKFLFVAGDFGIFRVDVKTRKVVELSKPAAVIDASMDGLYFYWGSLVGIQNGIHPGRVMRFYLDSTSGSIARAEILETYNPEFENPTTGSLDGDWFLFMANPQLHKWTPGKPARSPAQLHDIHILRIALAH